MMSCSNIEMRNDDLCFISQLPDPIIHHILSFLTHKDSAKTCVLSKTWNNLFASRHVMVFHERDFKVHSNAESKMFFMNFINQSLNRRMQIVPNLLERFELHLTYGPDENEVHPDHVKECLHKVFGIGVKTMSLILGYGRRLFGLVFVSQTLVELHVDCYFFMRACKTISLPNLKVLSLSDISLKDKSLKKLVLGCPMVEVLRLVHCHTPQKLHVSGFTRLVELGLCNCKNVQEVEIHSKYFQAFSSVGKEVGSNTIKLVGTCERVRKLELNAWLSTEFSTFNYLEELTLCGLCVMGRISSQSVKKLVIRSCGSKAEVVEIDCPNLVSLIYETIYRPFNFVTACNPSEFRCELCLLRSIHSSQLNAIENLFQSTFCATSNLNVVIALGPLQPIIIVEGWLSEAVMSILQKMEDLEPSPVVSITSHSFHWNGILPPYFPMAARLPVYLVSSHGNQFLKDALEKFLNLHKSRNGRYANLSSLEKSEWSSFPDELQRDHGSQYQIDGIALKFY